MTVENKYHKCVMLEKWATLDAYLLSQTKINSEHAAILSKLTHYVYEDGLQTKLALNKQTASSEVEAVEASLNRLWWGIGITSGIVMALLSFILYRI